MHPRPDPHFEDFARDCIRLAHEERSPGLRSRLLVLAREWMHAAMHHRVTPAHIGSAAGKDANPGSPWSEIDIQDLRACLDFGNTCADAAIMLCRDKDEVCRKAEELGLVEHQKTW
jgi:hypothetical protein